MKWQPIETAPKDGTVVIFYAPGGIFMAPSTEPKQASREERRKLAESGAWPNHQLWKVTHWMPLPPPPAIVAENKDG